MNYYDLQRISIQLMTVSTVVFGLTGIGAVIVNLPRTVTVISTSAAQEPNQESVTNCQKRITVTNINEGRSITMKTLVQTETDHSLIQDSFIQNSVAFRCVALKLYKVSGSSWTPLEENNVLSSTDVLGFGVIGGTTSGIIDKSRFRMQFGGEYTSWKEVTEVNTVGEFYSMLVLPSESGEILIEAQLHHSTLGWH